MAVFGRGKNKRLGRASTAGGEAAAPEGAQGSESPDSPASPRTPGSPDSPASPGEGDGPHGPWDRADVEGLGERIDLGALWVPPGLQVGLEIGDPGGRPIAVSVSMPGTAMRIQAFAAPRSAGIWDEVREELAEQAEAGGGKADDIPGPFGRELLAQLPDPARPKHRQPVVFWGVDGPRWFVRAVLTGDNVLEEQVAARFAQIFADTVVVRGPEARAPRELLDLHAPGEGQALPDAEAGSLDPMRRGPEITEIR